MSEEELQSPNAEELSIEDLKSITGGNMEIKTTDGQTLKWDLDAGIINYNHHDQTVRSVKIDKIRRLND